jgi:hypothetical protein
VLYNAIQSLHLHTSLNDQFSSWLILLTMT